jgi:hypothetical protein
MNRQKRAIGAEQCSDCTLFLMIQAGLFDNSEPVKRFDSSFGSLHFYFS